MTNSLKFQRQKAGLTLEELAAKTKLHFTTLSRIERDKRHLRVNELPLFARALGCTIDDLLNPERRTHATPHCLKAARMARGMTQARLAALLDVSRYTIERYEHGEISIPSHRLEQLTAIFAMRPGESSDDACPCLTLVGATSKEH